MTERSFAKVNEIIEQWEGKVTNLITILQRVQAEYRYLPEEVLTYIATALDLPATVYGVATRAAWPRWSPSTLLLEGDYLEVIVGRALNPRGTAQPGAEKQGRPGYGACVGAAR